MPQTATRAQRRHVPVVLAVLCLLSPMTLRAQEEPQNLQVLPETMTRREVFQVMRGFALGLGVRCSTCHVGEEGQPLSTYDFASDDKAMKLKARQMMKMVGTINGTYLAELPRRREPNVGVTCVTCHRGVRRPEPIESIVIHTIEADGVDAARDRYRALRERYYGSAAYDFTDMPLLAAVEELGDDADAALRILEMNLEFNPNSALTLFALGQVHADAGETDQAIDLLRRSLEILPENPRAQRLLRELTGGG